MNNSNSTNNLPKFWIALTPVIVLLGILISLIATLGADSVQTWGAVALLAAAFVSVGIGFATGSSRIKSIRSGLATSMRQVLPSFPILLLIGTVSATWMLSGVVPVLIEYGLMLLAPDVFLVVACVVSALISVLTGSSWTTIATIGVAFMGIGLVMGFEPGWIAGAIISGAYFGDKISPLSDTTVLASSSSGVNLFTHIRYMLLTTIPSMLLTIVVFTIVGIVSDHERAMSDASIVSELNSVFNLSPWLLIVPAATGILIAMRCNSYLTLSLSSLFGLAAMIIFQPGVISSIVGEESLSLLDYAIASITVLSSSTQLSTPSELLDTLVSTGGMQGMIPTVWLVTCAMIFGGVMLGTGMLASITNAMTRHIRSPRSTVTATVASGLALNSCTGDQYLSIIISSNIFRPMYQRNGLQKRLLSRTVEDSVSVTSVLVPWNSCGLAQSAVLGVATLTYLPYCIFNIISPLMSLAMAWAGIRIRRVAAIPA